jgi:hypothetical protein
MGTLCRMFNAVKSLFVKRQPQASETKKFNVDYHSPVRKHKSRVCGTHLRKGERYRMAMAKANWVVKTYGDRKLPNGVMLFAYRGRLVEHFMYGSPLPFRKLWTKHHRNFGLSAA